MRTALLALLLAPAAYGQCSSLQPAYAGLNGPVRALAYWTPGGAGPQQPRLVAGGAFTDDGQGSQDYIAFWNGTAWQRLGWGTDGRVNTITTWDPDGDGPLPAQLIIGGEFTHVGADSTGEVGANHIARWDGAAWRSLGVGTDGPVDALCTWDPDGNGAQAARLIAAGRFTHAGAAWSGGVAHWDGAAWGQFGWGIDGQGAAVVAWDPDGDGPQPLSLVVGGRFAHAGADATGQVNANNIARWDGAAWRVMGDGFPSGVTHLATLSGSPAEAADLFAGGYGLKRWDGSGWAPDGGGFTFNTAGGASTGMVTSLVSWDPDGQGPGAPELLAGGLCEFWVLTGPKMGYTVFVPLLAHFSQHEWVPLFEWQYTGSTQKFDALAADPSGQSALNVGCELSPRIQRLSLTPIPNITSQPVSASTRVGGSVSFSVAGGPASEYRWMALRHNDERSPMQLVDGPTPSGSLVSGSQTPVLTITGVADADAGGCYCVLVGCGASFSTTAELTITCSTDFNHDGDPATDADIEQFFRCMAGDCCATCDLPDFNGDGDDRTDADIESFFRVLAGGPC